jgi:SAM-dependent methyltransferase
MSTANAGTAAPIDVVPEWREAHLPTVFASAHPFLVHMQRPTVDAVIEAAAVKPGDHVIDIGCGSGIPALALAAAVGPTGQVTATDPSPVFVAAVKTNAAALGLTNLTAVEASAAGLPFAAGRFDAATCHFAVMFFPDVTAGLTRIRAVLRPGGRAGFVAWGPVTANTMFGSFWSAAGPYLPPDPPPDPTVSPADVPQPMRFAEPGSLSRALTAAGFMDVRESSRVVDLIWPGPAETHLAFWLDLTNIQEKVPRERQTAFHTDLLAALRRYETEGELRYSAQIVIASGHA